MEGLIVVEVLVPSCDVLILFVSPHFFAVALYGALCLFLLTHRFFFFSLKQIFRWKDDVIVQVFVPSDASQPYEIVTRSKSRTGQGGKYFMRLTVLIWLVLFLYFPYAYLYYYGL